MPTKDYKKKRDFSRTPEPQAGGGRKKGGRRFVIQKHDASTLHYDFRLEIDGVLKSWSVPKGPSTDPKVKRLAIETEDHPLSYADFEGVIPKGEYGGGTVLIWDAGTWRNITRKNGRLKAAAKAWRDGHLLVELHGKKLSGGYALQRIEKGKKPQWLLVKMDDEGADRRRNPTSTESKSVASGRSMQEIAHDRGDRE